MAFKIVLFLTLSPLLAFSQYLEFQPHAPAENPPVILSEEPVESEERIRLFNDEAPSEEWLFHKTEDSVHPDGNEQQMVWLMNRARSNPIVEGIYLEDTGHPIVPLAVAQFGVDLEVMKSEFAEFLPRPPAAFDQRIYEASRVHSEDLIARDAQDHNNQFDRLSDAGFVANGANASVFSYAEDSVHAHAAFNIDWGNDGGDGTGMQPGRGHRDGIMGKTYATTNVGIAMVPENDGDTRVGPLVTSIIYARAFDIVQDHYNRFLVGTVWEDLNENGFYDVGEGLAGVTVMPNRGGFYAVTSDSGGWALPATVAGDYTIDFSGGDLVEAEQRMVTVGEDSVLVLWNEWDNYDWALPDEAIVRVEKMDTGSEISWVAEVEHVYTVQVSTDLEEWTDDDRTVSVDGDLRTVVFTDEEVEGPLFVRIVSTWAIGED